MTFGAFLVVLDTTIVTISLPAIQRDLGSESRLEWVFTAYLVALGVSQPASGWLADTLGRKRAFLCTLVVFIIGSAFCAIAPNLGVLIAARVFQGLGGGMLIPITTAMIFEIFEPSERGRAMGIWGIALAVAPTLGPLVGGGIVDTAGWRWLFAVNLPIGVIGVALSLRYLQDSGKRVYSGLDFLGMALVGVGTIFLTVGLSEASQWGWASKKTLIVLLVGVLALAAFSKHALSSSSPILNVRLFTNKVFLIGCVTSSVIMIGIYGRNLYIPLELGTARNITEWTIGLVLLPSGFATALFMPIGGRLTDRLGSRLPVAGGAAIMCTAYFFLANLGPETGLGKISILMAISGVGTGIGMMSPKIVALNAISQSDINQASALFAVARQNAIALGTAGLVGLFSTVHRGTDVIGSGVIQSDIDPYNTVFLVCAFLMVLVFMSSVFLPGRSQMRAIQDKRLLEASLERTLTVEREYL